MLALQVEENRASLEQHGSIVSTFQLWSVLSLDNQADTDPVASEIVVYAVKHIQSYKHDHS